MRSSNIFFGRLERNYNIELHNALQAVAKNYSNPMASWVLYKCEEQNMGLYKTINEHYRTSQSPKETYIYHKQAHRKFNLLANKLANTTLDKKQIASTLKQLVEIIVHAST